MQSKWLFKLFIIIWLSITMNFSCSSFLVKITIINYRSRGKAKISLEWKNGLRSLTSHVLEFCSIKFTTWQFQSKENLMNGNKHRKLLGIRSKSALKLQKSSGKCELEIRLNRKTFWNDSGNDDLGWDFLNRQTIVLHGWTVPSTKKIRITGAAWKLAEITTDWQ